MDEVVVGIVGAGFAADLHVEAWRRVAGIAVNVRGVAAAHADRAGSFAARHGLARAFSDVDAMLNDPTITVVDLCVPNDVHLSLALAAVAAGKHIVVEKPLTGCFGNRAAMSATEMLGSAVAAASTMVEAARRADLRLCYAENWIYAPPVQRLRRLLQVCGGTALRIQGEESHSGTHAEANKHWATAGGGSLLGKGCHPIGAALHLKASEGRARTGEPIIAESVTAETAQLTKAASFRAEAHTYLQTGYEDVEDWGAMIVRFSDATVAEISASETSLGGVRNHLTVFASNAVVEANLNPNTAVRAYAPSPDVFGDEHLSEKLETNAGWSYPSPDENWIQGYPHEMQDFAEAVVEGRPPESDGCLGREVLAVVYAAYVSAAEGRRVEVSRA